MHNNLEDNENMLSSADQSAGVRKQSMPDSAGIPDGYVHSLEEILQGFDENRIADMLPYSRSVNYPSAARIVVEGADSRYLYYVEKGTIEVSYKVGDTNIVVAIIGSGSVFGEIGFFDGISRVRNIRATQDTTISIFDQESLRAMRDTHPLLYGDFVTMMAQSICGKFRRVVEERGHTVAYAASLSTRQRVFEDTKPVPEHFLQTDVWRSVSSFVESFKASIFELSHHLQQETIAAVPGELRDTCFEIMDRFNNQLQSASNEITDEELAEYLWGYVFKEIYPYFMRSKFAERAYYKPRGYAGDFLMTEMIYLDEPDGDGKLGMLMDAWCLASRVSRAVRGRRIFLAEQLKRMCGEIKQKQDRIRIMNLACGSSREFLDYLETCNYRNQIDVICIDHDPMALEYTNRSLEQFPNPVSLKLMQDNVVRWTLGRVEHSFDPQDIIYSPGIADYLDDQQLVALVERVFEYLIPGGTLVIGNLSYGNYNKTFFDEILQWRLVHRNEDDLKALFSKTKFGSNVVITAEENGISLFAIATKPF